MGCPFKALAHETRRDILKLISRKDLQVGEIASNFAMTKPSVSNHLRVLMEADLVINSRYKQFVTYSVNKLRLNMVTDYVDGLL